MKAWISAFRLRTLPLSFSPILLGAFLAAQHGGFSWETSILALSTTLFLQILSNLANDYGDGVKGTDNEERVGPQRAIQSGDISPSAMKNALVVFSIISFVSGLFLLFMSLDSIVEFFVFLGMGIAAIWAAIAYTVGDKAYGYKGLGDVFVLIFFGWMGAVGTFYLNTQNFSLMILLPATSVGLLAVAVLNLNNMRDRIPDAKSGKRTLAVLLGARNAKVYHTIILMLSTFLSVLYVIINDGGITNYAFLVVLIPISVQIKRIWNISDPKLFDPLLKQTALTAFLYAITFGLGQLL